VTHAQHGRGTGYRPDGHDPRDRVYARRLAHVARATEVSAEHLVRRIRDQGGTNSCTGQSAASAVALRCALDELPPIDPSALSAYWVGRAIDGWQGEDLGGRIRSVMRGLHGVGVASEVDWPFDPARINERPSGAAEIGGLVRAGGSYERVGESGHAKVETILDALQADCPVVLDIASGYLIDTKDTIPAPPPHDGGRTDHAVYLCGFDRGGARVRMANSWGTGWGDRGFCWLASEWLQYATDAWVLRSSKGGAHA
jgi:hypothetical protein